MATAAPGAAAGQGEVSVSVRVHEHVAYATMEGDGTLPWGTSCSEHRINPPLLRSVNAALDSALADESVHCVVVSGAGKFFSNGMDLKWIELHLGEEADQLQRDTERLLARIVAFPLPTIACINGHFTAAGAMLGLAFDYRVMRRDRGYFFVPAVDIGLVYSKGMTALMCAKTPLAMHRDMIVFARRYTAPELHALGVVEETALLPELAACASQLARRLSPKGSSALYRRTMHGIKSNLYEAAVRLLTADDVQSMGFENKPAGVDRAPPAARL